MGYATNRAKNELFSRAISGTQFRIMLVTVAPGDSEIASEFDTVSDVVAGECTFTNYTRKDVTPTATLDSAANVARLTLPSTITWTSAGGTVNNTVAGAWVFRRTTNGSDTPATDSLWAWLSGGGIATNGQDFVVTPNASGLMVLA